MPILNNLNANGETTLDCEISPDQNSQEIAIDFDCELFRAKPLTRARKNHYFGKIAFLSNIHKEISPKINERRQALSNTLFRFEDDFIPETGESLVALMLTIERQSYLVDI